ncbi:MAG: hypothetical protein JXA33_01500 [Anaerolineae bacterium]|nr:hypothetical protein [Anaerolineae bacterium]
MKDAADYLGYVKSLIVLMSQVGTETNVLPYQPLDAEAVLTILVTDIG